MSTIIDSIERRQLRQGLPGFGPGDRVRVHFQVIEGNRRRTQVFEGVVLKRQGSGARETFTVRKQSFGVGVERTFPAALAEDREARGRRPRRRAPGEALLPARPGRQGRPGRRAPLGDRRGADRRARGRRGEAEAIDSEGVSQERGRGRRRQPEAEARRPEAEEDEAPRPRRGGRPRPQPSPAEASRRHPRRSSGRRRARGGSRGRGRRGGRGRLRRGPGLNPSIPKPKTARGGLVELVVIVALALGLALGIQAFIVKPYQIPSESMEPTLDVGQRVLVNRFIYHFTDPGDRRHRRLPPAGRRRRRRPSAGSSARPDRALPAADRGRLGPELHQADRRRARRPAQRPQRPPGRQRGRARRDEDYIIPCGGGGACNLPKPITIPPDHYFMMGDNRGSSDDSRFWGPSPATGSSARPSPPTGRRTGSGSSKAHRRRLARTRRLFAFDRSLGSRLVAGADEAGRGCLAGPLVAAARAVRLRGARALATGARSPGCTTPSR